MQDTLDKAILWCLLDRPMTTWEMAEQVLTETNQHMSNHEKKKFCDRAKYRLESMMDRGYVIKDKKTRKYALENTTIGQGTLVLETDENETETIPMGKTIIVEDNGIIEVILMEEIIKS